MEEQSGFWQKLGPVVAFSKKHAVLLILLAVIILQFVPSPGGDYPWGGMWMRMQVKNLPVADSAAASSVEDYISDQIVGIAKQQYPNLPESNRQKVINDLKQKFREENKDQLESETGRLAQEIRDHYSYEENDRKFVYMPDIDPYFYLRFSRNILEKGHSYDVLKDGVPWDNHMVAPVGTAADRSWHGPLLAWMHRIHLIFDKSTTLMESATYFPIVFILLSSVFAFFVVNRIAGPIGGFFSATVLTLLPAIMSRTPWGHADTDSYNIFFPLLIIWLLFEALSAKSIKRQTIFGALTGLAFGIYANFWGNWWYLFDFVGAALIIAIVSDAIAHRALLKEGLGNFWSHAGTKKFVTIGAALFIVTAVFSIFTIGLRTFYYSVFQAAVHYTALKEAAYANLWPNTLTTVAELNPGSVGSAIGAVGGTLMFLIGLLGILLLLIKRDEHGKLDLTHSALLAIWFVGTMYMTLKGIRFTLLLGPAFAVAFGAGVGLLHKKMSVFGERQLHINKTVTGVLAVVIFGFVIINPVGGAHMVNSAYSSVVNDVPIMNDAWWNSLVKIRDNSQPDAIINSWWDFGHHFKYVADRAVTFDGASQNLPHSHWVGKALQTDNEDEAVAILRMLDCGANSAYDVAVEKLQDPLRAVQFVKRIIMLDKENAKSEVLAAGIDEKILDYTHCDAPEDYFIASGDMIGKSGVWAHFGMWSFERAETWLKWRHLSEDEAVPQMAERFNVSEETAKQLYNEASSLESEEAANGWISPWPGYSLQDVSSCSTSADTLTCGNIAVNLTSQKATIAVSQGTAPAGKIVVYSKTGERKEYSSDDGNKNIFVILWPSGDGMAAFASYSELAESMFTRLYFMGGLGLKHFKPFYSDRQLIGGMIHVYKVDWAGESAYIPSELKPKDKVEAGARVLANYIGWTDDDVFDSSIPNWKELNISKNSVFEGFNAKPLPFVVGKQQIIPGFESRIMGMKAGDMKTITVPPEEAYGTDPSKHPLANKTLHFKVQIVSVE